MAEISGDDAQWLDALRRGDASKHPDAGVLREALEQRAQQLLATVVPVADERMYSELKLLLRRERLLTATHAGLGRVFAIAATLFAVVALSFALLAHRSEGAASPSLRAVGGDAAAWVTDPQREAQALIERLGAAGIPADVHTQDAQIIVMLPATADAVAILERLELASSRAGNQLVVNFRHKP